MSSGGIEGSYSTFSSIAIWPLVRWKRDALKRVSCGFPLNLKPSILNGSLVRYAKAVLILWVTTPLGGQRTLSQGSPKTHQKTRIFSLQFMTVAKSHLWSINESNLMVGVRFAPDRHTGWRTLPTMSLVLRWEPLPNVALYGESLRHKAGRWHIWRHAAPRSHVDWDLPRYLLAPKMGMEFLGHILRGFNRV